MTELLKRGSKRWLGFWLTLCAYACVNVGNEVKTWLLALSPDASITPRDWANLGASTMIAVGLVFQALKNGAYQKAQNGTAPPGGGG